VLRQSLKVGLDEFFYLFLECGIEVAIWDSRNLQWPSLNKQFFIASGNAIRESFY
jgi:hypothetical protein